MDNGLAYYVEGGTCIVSTDYLAIPASVTQVKIGALPNGLKPVGAASKESTDSKATAYIAPLRFRGNDSLFGQIYVTIGGDLYAYVNNGGAGNAYYYGQLVFPVA